jgi:hypothetical protein
VHVRTEEAGLLGRGDRGLEPADRLGLLRADGDERFGCADRVGGDRGALDHRIRVELDQGAIGERRGVGAVAVCHDVAPWRLDRGRGTPLLAGREARAAAAAQGRRGDCRDRASRPEVADRAAQALERARGDGRIEIGGIGRVRALQQDRRPRGRRLQPVDHAQETGGAPRGTPARDAPSAAT